MSAPEPPGPSDQELAALVVGLAARVEMLEAENAELQRRLGMNSTNSSVPPSKDSIEAKAKRRTEHSSRERSKDRKPGGQPGRKGSGLAPTLTPDRTETLPPPSECAGWGQDLAGAVDAGMSWAQVWDILAVTLEKVHYLLPRRRCGCGKTTHHVEPDTDDGASGGTRQSSQSSHVERDTATQQPHNALGDSAQSTPVGWLVLASE